MAASPALRLGIVGRRAAPPRRGRARCGRPATRGVRRRGRAGAPTAPDRRAVRWRAPRRAARRRGRQPVARSRSWRATSTRRKQPPRTAPGRRRRTATCADRSASAASSDARQPQRTAAAAAALDVGTDRGLEEHAGALRRQRLVHEAVDEAVADQLREQRLVVAAPGDHDHHVRELVDDLLDQRRRLRRDRAHVEQQHAAATREQQVHRFGRGPRAPHRVALADGVAGRLVQGEVVGQHDDVHHHPLGGGGGGGGGGRSSAVRACTRELRTHAARRVHRSAAQKPEAIQSFTVDPWPAGPGRLRGAASRGAGRLLDISWPREHDRRSLTEGRSTGPPDTARGSR